MAQWSRADRTLHTKIVYYGPAFGGKTTNLETLHRITDPAGSQKLISIRTADDRTLFFDLLPFDLGRILGYQVAMKLYTVPGQVRYDATRQVVLSGADAVIFVADSSARREEQNRWAMQNLRMNMRARGLDPANVPVLFQFNKQDLEDAASPDVVGRWIGLRAGCGMPAVATRGDGVLETFIAATGAMLQELHSRMSVGENRVDPEELRRQVDSVFAPYLARAAAAPPPDAQARAGSNQIVLQSSDLLQDAINTSVTLGEKLADESARRRRMEEEVSALRSLGASLERVGSSFDRDTIIDEALAAAAKILSIPVVSLLIQSEDGRMQIERCHGREADPLLTAEHGRALIDRMLAAGSPGVVPDLSCECPIPGLRAVAAVPTGSSCRGALLAYAGEPDGLFSPADVRFLATLAGHLSLALEKSRLYLELSQHRARLEALVESRTQRLRSAYEELRRLDETKDRFLGNLSREMKTPLAALLGSAIFLREQKSNAEQRKTLLDAIVGSGEKLQRLLDGLRGAGREGSAQPLEIGHTSAEMLVQEAVALSGHATESFLIQGQPCALEADLSRLARALANVMDNAVKFGGGEGPVAIRLREQSVAVDEQPVDGLVISVVDGGPGIDAEALERIFAPFEQGEEPGTPKPEGVGLGLYEARAIIEQHCGTIEYVPLEPGSEFRVSLPLAAAARAKKSG